MGIEIDARSIEWVNKYIINVIRIVDNELKLTLTRLGEECVIKIKDRSGEESWFDQTGNLRSSIGYAVYVEGKTFIESEFNQIKDGFSGTQEGRRMIEELAKTYANTYALVVVAGMSYAEYVEAMENKDVLASTELWAKSTINSYLEKAKESALKKIGAIK